MAKKMSNVARTVYALVGVSGAYSAVWLVTSFTEVLNMGLLEASSIILLTVGGLNWGLAALTGDKRDDLFGILNL